MSAFPRRPVGRRATVDGRRTYWTLCVSALALALLGVSFTASRVAVLERQRAVGQARETQQRLGRELRAVELELASLAGAGRVQRAAEERLQMHRPAPGQVVPLKLQVARAAAQPLPREALAAQQPAPAALR